MIDAADFVNSHQSPWSLLGCGVQIVCAFLVLTVVAERRVLTPRPVFLWRPAIGPAHQLLRLAVCAAYIGIIFGAGLSGFGVLSAIMGWADGRITDAQNDFGVLVRTLSGAFVFLHLTYVFPMLVRIQRQCYESGHRANGAKGRACSRCALRGLAGCARLGSGLAEQD